MSSATTVKKTLIKLPKKSRKERRKEKEVRTLQEQANNILPATTFKRIVTQTAADFSANRLRFNADAVKALQAATEQEITTIFTGSAFCAGLGKRETVTIEDMRNYQILRTLG